MPSETIDRALKIGRNIAQILIPSNHFQYLEYIVVILELVF